jgi:hypothetical protein
MIPPGLWMPLHSHPDPETLLHVCGDLEALGEKDGRLAWVEVKPGEAFHAPGGAKHAFRNAGREPAVSILVSTANMGRFFREIGNPAGAGAPPAGPPSGERIQRLRDAAARYGHWIATAEENARVGLPLPSDP